MIELSVRRQRSGCRSADVAAGGPIPGASPAPWAGGSIAGYLFVGDQVAAGPGYVLATQTSSRSMLWRGPSMDPSTA
jgi:hypothetical protein